MFPRITSLRSLLFLALVCALVPIWITQREMWDGVAIEYAFETGDLSGLFHATTASGWLMASWIYNILWFLQSQFSTPYWLGIDILYTLTLLGMAYEVRQLSSHRLGLSNKTSTVVVILFLAHPIWHFLMSGAHIVHMTGLWFLLLGHRLTSQKSIFDQVAGWVIVTASFQFPGSIVMIFWLEWMLYRDARKSLQHNNTRAVLVALYATAWYVASRTILGPTQTFGGYNQLLLPTSVESIKMITWTGLKFASWLLILGAPVWIASIWRLWGGLEAMRLRDRANNTFGATISSPLGAVLVGCFIAIAPYWAVGKGPVVVMPYDWTARNALPLALPLSLLLALLIERYQTHVGVNQRPAFENRLLAIVLACWLAISTLGVAGKLYQIKLEKAIEASLRKLAPPHSGMVTLKLPFDPVLRIRQNEANGLLWRAYGRAEWAVMVGPPASWVQLIKDTYVGEQPTAVKHMKDLPLWAKFMVMGDLTNFNCETTLAFTLPDGEKGLTALRRWLGWSPFVLKASLEKTTCPQ